MQVVVTGATSFIGAATVKKINGGGAPGFAVVRPASSNMKHLEKLAGGEADGLLTICPLDLADIRTLHGFWQMPGFTSAGTARAVTTAQSGMQQRNVTYALDAVEAAAALGCRRFYLPDPRRSTESGTRLWQRTRPAIRCLNMARQRWIFAKSENTLQTEEYGVYSYEDIQRVRSGDHPWSLVQSCLRAFCEGGSMKLGECTQNWNFLYIDDAAAALVSPALRKPGRCLQYWQQRYQAASKLH